MSTAPRCPACGTPHSFTSAAPGTMLLCESCREVFEAPGTTEVAPPGPLPGREPATGPEGAGPAEPPPAPRSERTSGGGVWLALLAACVAVFVAVVLTGLAVALVAREREEAAWARAQAAEREAEEARRAAAEERLRLEAKLAAAREQAKPPEQGPRRVATKEPATELPEKPAGPPAISFKPGTQTQLRPLRSIKLPEFPKVPERFQSSSVKRRMEDYCRLAHSPKHQILFVLHPRAVWAYDLRADKEIGMQRAEEQFTDLSLAPDQSALFATEFGGGTAGNEERPRIASRVHRFDLAARKWETREAPRIAYRVEAVDAGRVLLLESSQWVDVTLNRWEFDGVGVRELARCRCGYGGDLDYDPRTGRIYHGSDNYPGAICVRKVDGNELEILDDHPNGAKVPDGGPGVALSRDGSRLYYGAVQVDVKDVEKSLQKLPEVIVAASRDVAFGSKAYYRASTGSKLGEYDFVTSNFSPRDPWRDWPAAVAVSPDGLSVWVLDRGNRQARQFALESEK